MFSYHKKGLFILNGWAKAANGVREARDEYFKVK